MYRLLKTLIPREQCNLLASIVQNQPFREDDNQVPNSWVYPNLPAGNIMLGLLRDRIAQEAGKNLLPTYSYTRIYNSGNVLEPHVDRESCEWSVTINLSQTHPWPIYMNDVEVIMDPGDGVLYQGNIVKHYRKAFEGIECIQMFLHYVDADGPFKDHVFDIQRIKARPEPLWFRFAKENRILNSVYTRRGAFAKFECESIIDHFKTKCVEKAGIGDGVVVETVRKSRTYFIPKLNTYKWIYSRVMDIVSETKYDFELYGIEENMQFTEYDASYSGNYTWHVDMGRTEDSTNRKLSVSIQLSDEDDYEGGNLEFDEKDVTTRQQGTAFVFPSYKRHQVTPVTRGTRYSLVLWVAGPPFR
jgi:PKHD-type hydroxylase